jgi:hypothetical protein
MPTDEERARDQRQAEVERLGRELAETYVKLGSDITVQDLILARLRVELYAAIQHPDMGLRRAVWDLLDEILEVRAAVEPKADRAYDVPDPA